MRIGSMVIFKQQEPKKVFGMNLRLKSSRDARIALQK